MDKKSSRKQKHLWKKINLCELTEPSSTNFFVSFNQNEDSFDKTTWDTLYKISQKTFVDETESSKKTSAGAGLTDNDWD